MAMSIATFGPATFLLGLIAIRQTRAFADPATREVSIILIVLAILAPLLLHLVAWDRHRWNAIVAFNAGLAALLTMRARPDTVPLAGAVKPVGLAGAVGVALWSLTSDPVFFNQYAPAHPPFVWQVQFLLEFFRTWNWEMWLPVVGN
jgi:hypothetical protein